MLLKKITICLVSSFFFLQITIAGNKKETPESAKDNVKFKKLVDSFMEKLISDTPFTMNDEVEFFGDFSYSSFMIMNSLGFMDKRGKWIKEKPKYSYLGALFKMKKDVFVPKGENYGYYIFPATSSYYIELPNKNPLISRTHFTGKNCRYLFLLWKNHETANGYMKTIFFLLKKIHTAAGEKDIMQPAFCMVNGKNLLQLLGFKTRIKKVKTYGNRFKERKELYLPDEILKELQLQIKDLETKK